MGFPKPKSLLTVLFLFSRYLSSCFSKSHYHLSGMGPLLPTLLMTNPLPEWWTFVLGWYKGKFIYLTQLFLWYCIMLHCGIFKSVRNCVCWAVSMLALPVSRSLSFAFSETLQKQEPQHMGYQPEKFFSLLWKLNKHLQTNDTCRDSQVFLFWSHVPCELKCWFLQHSDLGPAVN